MIIAIDPGLSGGIGVVTDHGGYVAAYPMPVKAKSATKRELDAAGLADLLTKYCYDAGALNSTVILERQRPFPGQGVSSMFSLGDSVGCIRGICAALGLTLVYAEPQTWKKWHRLPGGKKRKQAKEMARSKATDLYPMAPLSRKKDEGVAEALLIARWYALNGRPVPDEPGTRQAVDPRTPPTARLPRGAGSNPAPRRN